MSAEPPITAAMMTMLSAAMVAWLTPTRIIGMAEGTCTHQSSWRSVLPDMRADSVTSAGTRLRPSMVLRTMGGAA